RLLHTRRRQRQLVEQGATDPLTGLCNRRGATARIEALPPPSTPSAQDEDTRHALLLVDLDRFKAINDAHGHAAGDRVLAQVADRLRKACDDGDILARWGGEEFLVVRPDSSREAAFAFADHLRRAIEHETFDIDDARALAVTVSIGLAPSPFFPATDARWTDAIDLADRALYVAKHAGRNAWSGIWGLAGGEHLDLHDLRENPEQALAQGLVAIGGNRPMSWSPLRDPRPAQGPAPDGDAGQDRQAGHGA
ncbi:MAG TPA: GGDEF domain-containing protein, partial [Luteimonas sp.]|nr:GGDEF domain-containing protein [Luteimonas sp.]